MMLQISLVGLLLFILGFEAQSSSFSSKNDHKFEKDITLFSENGELLQVNYAKNAALKGDAVLCGISSENEIVICASSRKFSSLLDRRSIGKLMKIDKNMYCTFAGLSGDGQHLMNAARLMCVKTRTDLGFPPLPYSIGKQLANKHYQASLLKGMTNPPNQVPF
jgi:20S proteasome alpha/beta subunit